MTDPAQPVPRLETQRFTLRKLIREDAEALFPTLSDPKICEFMLRSHFETLGELADWLCDPHWNGRSWSAIDRQSGQLVARVVAVPAGDRTAEIGYITIADRMGEGIATECVSRLIDYLFGVEGHHRITAGTDPRNAASNAVLRKLGFRQEAHFRQSVKTHLGWCDEYYWGLLQDEWAGRAPTHSPQDASGTQY